MSGADAATTPIEPGRLARWSGPGLAGLACLVTASTMGPLVGEAAGPGAMAPGWYDLLVLGPVTVAALGVIVGSLRAAGLGARRADYAAVLALGMTRRSLVAADARRGLAQGLTGALAGGAAGLGFSQASAGWSGHVSWTALWSVILMTAGVVGAVAAAYGAATAWAARGAVASVGQRRTRTRAAFVAVALVPPVTAAAFVALTAHGFEPSGPVVIVALAAWLLAGIEVPVLLAWAGGRVARSATGGAARFLSRRGAAARIAADGLAHPTRGASVALGGVVLALGALLAIGTVVNAQQARNAAIAAVTPDAAVSAAHFPHGAVTAEPVEGWATGPSLEALAASLADEPGLTVVPAALLTAQVIPDGDSLGFADTLVAVEPADLAAVADAPGALPLGGSLAWAVRGGASLQVQGAAARIDGMSAGTSFDAIDRAWAEARFGPATTTSLLVYAVPGVDVAQVLTHDDTSGLEVVFGDGRVESAAGAPRDALAIVGTILLAVALGLAAAFAAAGQRSRARDLATLAALGATRSRLTWAAALESALTTGAAAIVGVTGGALAGLVLWVWGSGVPTREWPGTASFAWAHAPWGTATALAGLSVLAAAALGAATRSRSGHQSPVEQVRDAVRAGAS